MKRNKIKILLALCLVLCTVFNAVMFNLLTVYAESGMTQEETDRANRLYGTGNWSYDAENDIVVPTEDAQKNLGDFLLTGFGIAHKAVDDAYNWMKNEMQDIINKHFDDIAIKNDLLYIPKEAVDELHQSIEVNLIPLQGYYLLEPNFTKAQMKALCTLSNSAYQPTIDEFIDSHESVFATCSNGWTTTPTSFHISVPNTPCYYAYQWKTNTRGEIYSYNENVNIISAFDLYNVDVLAKKTPLIECYPQSYLVCSNDLTGILYAYSGPTIKIFNTPYDLSVYLRQLKGIGSQNLYISQKFYDYESSELNVNLNTYNNTNWNTTNQTIYNEVVNNRDITYNENGIITENDLELIIDTAINKYMFQNNPGGGDNPGGNTGDNPGGGGTLVIPEETQTLFNDILNQLKLIVEQNNLHTDMILNIQHLFDNEYSLLGEIKNILSEMKGLLEEIIKKIEDTGEGSFLDNLMNFISDILSTALGGIISGILDGFIQDLIDLFIGDQSIPDNLIDVGQSLASNAQSKFPMCIPWDVIAVIGIMSAEPEAPVIELPFKVESIGFDETLTLDLTKYEVLAEISRTMCCIIFLLYLLIQTRNLYGALNK